MKELFKFSGFALIILTTFLLGYLKSNSLNIRRKKLYGIKNAVTDLKQRIRLSNVEIDKLISICFKDIDDCYSNLEKAILRL